MCDGRGDGRAAPPAPVRPARPPPGAPTGDARGRPRGAPKPQRRPQPRGSEPGGPGAAARCPLPPRLLLAGVRPPRAGLPAPGAGGRRPGGSAPGSPRGCAQQRAWEALPKTIARAGLTRGVYFSPRAVLKTLALLLVVVYSVLGSAPRPPFWKSLAELRRRETNTEVARKARWQMINQIRARKAEVINEFSLIVYSDGHLSPFLPLSSETTRGFISQTSSCRARRAGGNSFQMSSVLLSGARLSIKPRARLSPGTRSLGGHRGRAAPRKAEPRPRSPGAAVEHTEPERTAQGSAPGRPRALQGECRAPFGKPGLTQPRLRPRGAALAPPAPLWGLEPPRGAPRAQPPPATGGGSGCRSGAV